MRAMSKFLITLSAASLLASASLHADNLRWGTVGGREAAERSPEWVCHPDESGSDWACEGDSRHYVRDFDPESIGKNPGAPQPTEDLAEAFFVPREALDESVRAGTPEFCAGVYQEPDYPFPPDTDNLLYPVVTEADQIEYELGRTVTLRGDVRFAQGNRSVTAAQAEVDNQTRKAQLAGGVRLQEPGLLLQGERAEVDLNTDEAALENAQFLILANQFRGRSESIEQNADGDLNMAGNEFTRCEPGNNNWRLNAESLTVEKGEVFGTARNAVLRVRDVPVFYTPYIKFPVTSDRQSGFLFPNFAYSGEDGLDIAIPYYLNLAPNYDATVVPRYISDRGVGMEGEFRHLAEWQEAVFSGGYLAEDDLFDGTYAKDDFQELFPGEPFKPADRWLVALDQQGRIGPVRTIVDYADVSDRDYFRDLGTDLALSSQIELEQRAELRYRLGNLSARLWGQSFQRLDEVSVDPYRRLPELALSYLHNAGPALLSLDLIGASFDRDTDGLRGTAAVTGERFHAEPKVRLPFSWPFGFFTASGGYSYTRYDLEKDPAAGAALADSSPDRSLAFGSLDGGLFFDRDLNVRGKELVQTLEPRLFYLYRTFEDQSDLPRFDASELTFSYNQLFRETRFAGLDRRSDANQLSAGVTSRFVDALSGREYFSASIGQIFYFDDRRVTLSGSPDDDDRHGTSALASQLVTTLGGYWSLRSGVIWDPNDNEVDESWAQIRFRRDNQHIFNVGYRHREQNDIRQSDLSLYWPISRHWSIMGRWNYDFESNRTIEGFGGIEYNDCCWQVRLMARRFLDSPTGRDFADVEADEGIFLQFVFKGLAGFGGKVESVLSRGIRGYRTEAQAGYENW